MHDNTKTILEKARKQDLARQRQIEAQKESINRLLAARESETSDADLITELCNERRELVEGKAELQARIDAVNALLAMEEGALQIRCDLIREALNG